MMPDIKSRFGSAVRARRKRLGYSQEELAGRAGLHRTYIADIERGARNLSLANIEKLAKALDSSIPILFTEVAVTGNGATNGHGDILLVEDDPSDREITLRAFRTACLSNRVQVAHDGPEALDYLFNTGAFAEHKHPRPEVILLDLNLPKLPGLEVLRRIKTDPRTSGIPVAVLTSSERTRDVEESRRLGADTYIVKPVDFQRFSQATPQLKLCWVLHKNAAS